MYDPSDVTEVDVQVHGPTGGSATPTEIIVDTFEYGN